MLKNFAIIIIISFVAIFLKDMSMTTIHVSSTHCTNFRYQLRFSASFIPCRGFPYITSVHSVFHVLEVVFLSFFLV